MSSQSLNGKVEQTRIYGLKGKAKWDTDFSIHSNALRHSNPHAHPDQDHSMVLGGVINEFIRIS